MEQFEMLRKGQTNIKLTTNAKRADGDEVKIHKLVEINGTVTAVDITPSNPAIASIAGGILKQHIFNAPNEDCYLLAVFNGSARFYRIGSPTIRMFAYTGNGTDTVSYTLLDFEGIEIMAGNMVNIGVGVYYMTPNALGDFIFRTAVNGVDMGIKAAHTPYMIDTAGMTGKIIFQKDSWMLLAVPKVGATISDLVEDIEAKYGVLGKDIFNVFNAYPATDDQFGEMLDYNPGFTPNSTKYNFSLVYGDGNAKEITGFWCNTRNYTINGDPSELVVYEWEA